MAHWLLKSEPSTFSFSDLEKAKKTNWNGVRNFQARNFMRQVAKGDLCLIYHSGDERAVVGTARVSSAPYADPDPKKKGEWFQFDIVPVDRFKTPVPLSLLKVTKDLEGLLLIKQSRLSVMPVSEKEFAQIEKLGAKS